MTLVQDFPSVAPALGDILGSADVSNSNEGISFTTQQVIELYNALTAILTNKSFDVDGAGNSITNIANANIKALAGIELSKLAVDPLARANHTGTQDINTTTTSTLLVNRGGTGEITAQAAINSLTAVAAATDEHVLTKDTATGNAIFKAVPGGGGGEVNTHSSVGGGTFALTAAISKVGVDLQLISVSNGTGMNAVLATDVLTLAVGTDVVRNNISNAYTSGMTQKFGANATLAGINLTGGTPSNTLAGDIWITPGDVMAFRNGADSADILLAASNVANAWGTVNQNIASTGKWQEGGVAISPIGLHDIWMGTGAAVPITAGAVASRIIGTGDNRKGLTHIPFTNGVNEFATFQVTLPRNFDNGTITVVIKWISETEGAGDVIWGVAAVAASDGDDLTAAGTNYGTEITVTDTQTTINFEQFAPRTAAITIANTHADSDTLYIRVQRRGADGGDTFTQPAQLTGIYYDITTDAPVSA